MTFPAQTSAGLIHHLHVNDNRRAAFDSFHQHKEHSAPCWSFKIDFIYHFVIEQLTIYNWRD